MIYGADTTFLIDLLNRRPNAVRLAESLGERRLVTTQICAIELLEGAYLMEHNTLEAVKRVEKFLHAFQVIELNEESIDITAKCMAILKNEGNAIALSDCLIGNMLKVHGCDKLITNNSKHFNRIKGLEVVTY